MVITLYYKPSIYFNLISLFWWTFHLISLISYVQYYETKKFKNFLQKCPPAFKLITIVLIIIFDGSNYVMIMPHTNKLKILISHQKNNVVKNNIL